MKKVILIIGLILASLGAYTYYSKPANCAWCPTYTCYGSCGGGDCVCVTPPGKLGGSCYSISR